MKENTFTVEVFGSKGWEIVAEGLSKTEAIRRFGEWCLDDDSSVRLTKEG